nr:immunoglobulin heavy chain junction region [Mus musculus]
CARSWIYYDYAWFAYW